MSIAIREVTADDAQAYVQTMMWAAGRPVDDELSRSLLSTWDLEQARAAFDGDRLIGTIGTRSLTMTVPGGATVPIAGIGQGGVLPSHTRRGIMHELMLDSLSRAAVQGAVLAAWTTSAWPLYRRYGGGVATLSASGVIEDLPAARVDDEIGGRVDLAASAEVAEVIVDLHVRASSGAGNVARDARYWRERLRRADRGLPLDVLATGASAPAALYALHRPAPAAAPDGCVIYRVHQRWEAGLSRSELEVLDFIAVDDAAARDLWRFLLGFGFMRRLVIEHMPTDPLLRWLLHDGRLLQTTAVTDHVWVRVLDVERALSARTYHSLVEPIRIAVRDPLGLCDSDAFEIDAAGVRRVGPGVARIELDVAMLSALLLGGAPVWTLAAAGRLPGLDAAELRALDRAFAADGSPFCDSSF